VINELGGEKIDIIEYSNDSEKFIISSLQPADNLKVKLDEKKKTAVVTAPEDQLSLAIGRDGQNVRLAAKLTGYKLNLNPPKAKKAKKAKPKDDKSTKKSSKKTETPA